jgi:hypothetical protein
MSKDFQKQIFSENLNNLVFESGKKQSEIAKAIVVSPQTFNTWTQGIAIPRMDKIQLLADYFRVKKSALIEKHYSASESENIGFNETQRSFAKNLNQLLSSNNKTQLELANFIGVSNTAVNKWTKGCNTPRMDKIDLICSFFHIQRKDLFAGAADKQACDNNAEINKVSQAILDNTDLRALLYTAMNLTPKQLKIAIEVLKQFKECSL